MSLNEHDLYQLTSGSVLPPTSQHRTTRRIGNLPKEQVDELREFIAPFVRRRDKGVHIQRMCFELGLLTNKETGKVCSSNCFYRIQRKVKDDNLVGEDRKKQIDLFKRLKPYCRRGWIMKILNINEKQYEYLKARYPIKSGSCKPIGNFTIGLMIDPDLLMKIRTDPTPTEDILNKALEQYYQRDEID